MPLQIMLCGVSMCWVFVVSCDYEIIQSSLHLSKICRVNDSVSVKAGKLVRLEEKPPGNDGGDIFMRQT